MFQGPEMVWNGEIPKERKQTKTREKKCERTVERADALVSRPFRKRLIESHFNARSFCYFPT